MMLHIGNLDQLQLPALLERIQTHQKTGKVIVIYNDVQEESCLPEHKNGAYS